MSRYRGSLGRGRVRPSTSCASISSSLLRSIARRGRSRSTAGRRSESAPWPVPVGRGSTHCVGQHLELAQPRRIGIGGSSGGSVPSSESGSAASPALPASCAGRSSSAQTRRPRRSGSRRSAWRGGGRPVAALSRLRSSTAASESKPSSLKRWSAPIAAAAAWPRTAATCARTRSSSAALGAGPAGQRPARLRGAARVDRRGCAAAAAARRPGTSAAQQRREFGARRRSARRSSRHGHAGAASAPVRSASSNSARPSVGERAGRPRGRSGAAGRRRARRPCRRRLVHRPQASEPAGRPGARRCAARRVQEGVGRRVVGLARRRRGHRRRRRRARRPPGPGRGSARAGARPRRPWAAARSPAARGSSAVDDAVVEHARPRAPPRSAGARRGLAASSCGQGRAVGHVAGGHLDLGAQLGQLGRRVRRRPGRRGRAGWSAAGAGRRAR